MNKIKLSKYNLEMTLFGGQAFNWDSHGEHCYGFTQDKIIKIKKEKDFLYWQTYPEKDNDDFIKSYFKFDINYDKILEKINKDQFIKKAIKKYPNLRLLKQDFNQCILSFIVSANNNIKSIRKIIRAFSKKFGKKVLVDNNNFYLFPEAEVLAEARMEDLLECKLGFRAKYLKGAASHILATDLNNKILTMKEPEAKMKMKEINGVGDKIADCVLVFGLGFDNITPLDVWGKRVCTKFYKLSPKMKYEEMRNWLENYFDGYAAWAGQFLFEYIRHLR